MSDWLFDHGELVAIESPLPRTHLHASMEDDFYEYGIDPHAQWFGDDQDLATCLMDQWTDRPFRVYGPCDRHDAPYQYVCVLVINDAIELIWCRDFASLHAYLLTAAPLINLFRQDRVGSVLIGAYHLLFDDEGGLFSDLVVKRQLQHEREQAKRVQERLNADRNSQAVP